MSNPPNKPRLICNIVLSYTRQKSRNTPIEGVIPISYDIELEDHLKYLPKDVKIVGY